jgi:hypothetical protein
MLLFCPIASVWPSGLAFDAASRPIRPDAPARFSASTGCPSRSVSRGPISRTTMSAVSQDEKRHDHADRLGRECLHRCARRRECRRTGRKRGCDHRVDASDPVHKRGTAWARRGYRSAAAAGIRSHARSRRMNRAPDVTLGHNVSCRSSGSLVTRHRSDRTHRALVRACRPPLATASCGFRPAPSTARTGRASCAPPATGSCCPGR